MLGRTWSKKAGNARLQEHISPTSTSKTLCIAKLEEHSWVGNGDAYAQILSR